MIKTTPLDQLPSNVQIVQQNGLPTQAFVFYLLKMFRKANTDNSNFESLQNQITALTKQVITPTSNYSVPLTGNYVILADASLQTVSITLPIPVKGTMISISKVDTSPNGVIILPHGTELVAGESFQELLYQDEVLDFVSDGFNWYLGG